MESKQLRYFLAVAEEQHFGRAAEQLGIKQPPLSRQVQSLEQELGVRLFDRSSKGASLTEAGKMLLVEARDILSRLDRAAGRMRTAETQGSVTIGFISNLAYQFVPTIASELQRCSPSINLQWSEAPNDKLVRQLKAGELDLALLTEPFDELSLITRRLFEDPLLLAMPAIEKLEDARLADILSRPFVGCPRYRKHGFQKQLDARFEAIGLPVPRISQEADDKRTMVALVAAGVGCAVVPSSARSYYLNDDVVFRNLLEVPPIEIAVAWWNEPSVAARKVIDTAIKESEQYRQHHSA